MKEHYYSQFIVYLTHLQDSSLARQPDLRRIFRRMYFPAGEQLCDTLAGPTLSVDAVWP